MKKNILWDFDGVILDSMDVRDYGFQKIFENYPVAEVQKLIDYHRKNGGWSRYVKIRYFYEEILNRPISDYQITELATAFSIIMKEELVKPNYLIVDSLEFIRNNYKKFNFHIVSGSDEKELQFLCEKLDLSPFFITINGSPTTKTELVANVMQSYAYNKIETILIGDSTNDFEAAKKNMIGFYGYNNTDLIELSDFYIHSFNEIEL